jgi:hypothetical protein
VIEAVTAPTDVPEPSALLIPVLPAASMDVTATVPESVDATFSTFPILPQKSVALASTVWSVGSPVLAQTGQPLNGSSN